MGSSMDAGVQIMLGNVEPFHAKLIFTQTGLAIADAGSATGTFVNGEKVDGEHAAAGGRSRLPRPSGRQGQRQAAGVPAGGRRVADARDRDAVAPGHGARAVLPRRRGPGARVRRRGSRARLRPRRRGGGRIRRRGSALLVAAPAGGPARADAPGAGPAPPPPAPEPPRPRVPAGAAARSTSPAAAARAARARAPSRPGRSTTATCRRSPWSASPRPRAEFPSLRPAARPAGQAGRQGERQEQTEGAAASRCRRSRWCRSSAALRLSRSWALSSGSSCCARRRPELASVAPDDASTGRGTRAATSARAS